GTKDGSNWANASNDLQAMIDLANTDGGGQVWVSSGTYIPTALPGADTAPTAREYAFVLKKGVEVYGGFNGTESLLADRDYANNVTILSGDAGIPNNVTDNLYHVVLI